MDCTCDNILPQGRVTELHYDNCRSVWEKEHPGQTPQRNEDGTTLLPNRHDDGTIRLPNRHLQEMDQDFLYHLDFNTKDNDLKKMFSDVKFVCTGGKDSRMLEFARYMSERLDLPVSKNLTESTGRYAMYKVGPVLTFSHGVGIPSMTTALQEVIKMLAYAKAKDPIIIRLGSCGGLGVEAGCAVISTCGVNGLLTENYFATILGSIRRYPTKLDTRVAQEIMSLASKDDEFNTYLGKTMASDDFYRGQARLDGPFCDYTNEDKMRFLREAHAMGVRNIEMEATAFAAFTKEAGIRSAICCVPFLNRLNGDQVTATHEEILRWENRPMILVGRYIEAYVNARA